MCCFAVSQLLVFGKSIISHANKIEDEADDDKANIEWPEDVTAKANIIRVNAQTMIGYVEAVSNSFITGWFFTDSTLYYNHVKVCPLYLYALNFHYSQSLTFIL